jgi:hypothetical protein
MVPSRLWASGVHDEFQGGPVKRDLWALSIVALLAAGAVLLLKHSKEERTATFRFVDDGTRDKNFDAFPPEIPEYEFDEADFFS